MHQVLTIGIAGGSGSGKTTITRRLREHFKDSICTLYHDNYYKAHDSLTLEERARLNYDCPEAFDTYLLAEHLALLRQGRAVACPVYDYAAHNRSHTTQLVQPAPVVLVEGILILQDAALCDMLDIRVFVDADADVRILRRILRDVQERGRSLDSVVDQYLTTVKPMHEQYVEPSRRRANIIVPEGGHNQVAVQLLIQRIQAHLEGR